MLRLENVGASKKGGGGGLYGSSCSKDLGVLGIPVYGTPHHEEVFVIGVSQDLW